MKLPAPIAAYVEAANAQDAQRAARCFTADASVRDDGAVLHGTAAIADWMRESGERYQSTIAPLAVTEADGKCTLAATVSGNFPGSPATLHFHFVLAPAGIASLEVTA